MPLYEYQCESCGNRFERIQKFSDPPVEACPSCEGPVRKLLSSPAIQFKGSGWYITDYARKAAPKEGAKPSGAESGTAAEASSSSESKPAADSTAASGSPGAAGSTSGS